MIRLILWSAVGFGVGSSIWVVVWNVSMAYSGILGYIIGVSLMGAIGGASLGKGLKTESRALAWNGAIGFLIGGVLGVVLGNILSAIIGTGFAYGVRVAIMGLFGSFWLSKVLMKERGKVTLVIAGIIGFVIAHEIRVGITFLLGDSIEFLIPAYFIMGAIGGGTIGRVLWQLNQHSE